MFSILHIYKKITNDCYEPTWNSSLHIHTWLKDNIEQWKCIWLVFLTLGTLWDGKSVNKYGVFGNEMLGCDWNENP